MKKNVLQLIGSFNQGGSEQQAVGLTRLLNESGAVNVSVATLNREGPLLANIESLGFAAVPEFKLTSFFNLNFYNQLKRFAHLLKTEKIDVVHTHDFYTNVFGMLGARYAGVPCRIASKRETGGMRSGMQKRVEKFAFRLADAVVVNSEAVRDYLISESVRAEKLGVIYNGLDLARLKPKTEDRAAICESFGLPADENIKFVTLVANLRHSVKNQPMFLKMAQRVISEYPAAHFVIAGEGELRKALENSAGQLGISGNVHFIGRCDAMAELLFISDVCTLTSYAEGFSNSIIEYMAAGRPVVATSVGGAAEAVVEGKTGYLVASDDDEAMAKRVLMLLQDDGVAREMGAAGRELAERKFSVGNQLKQTLELYDRGGRR